MGKVIKFLTPLLLIVIIFLLAYTSWVQKNDTVSANIPSSLIVKSEVSQVDILGEAQRSLDRSISILNIVATSMGVLVGLLAVILSVGSIFGYLELIWWKRLRKKAEEDAKAIENIREEEEKKLEKLRREIKVPSSLEAPSPELKKELDELIHRLEALEMLGASLKPEDCFKRGYNLYHKGKYELALEALEKAIELKQNYTMAWHGKGGTLIKLSRYKEALKALEKAIELKQDYAEAWSNKGYALIKLGKYELALEALEKAIELKQNYAEAWNNKGIAFIKLKRYEEALKALEKAIELKKGYANAWYNKGCAYSWKGDIKNAIENLSKAIELDAKWKEKAKKDEDFKNFWDDEDFKRITK